jgi:hypothetical protein
MSTRLRASLEAAIQKWADAECEEDDWSEHYAPPSLIPNMAQAAYLVFQANADGQAFAKEQEE